MAMTMRVVGDGEGKSGKALATATRVAGKRTVRATKTAMAATTRLRGTGGGNDRPLRTP
jgi:hypothetical protein